MPEIPSFQLQPNVSVGALVDDSGVHQAWQQLFGKINQGLERKAVDLAANQSAQAGAVAGEQLGYQPIPNIGASSKAYNQAALQVNKHTAGAEALKTINDLHIAASKDISPQSIQQFKQSAESAGKGILEAVPAENRPYVKSYLAHASAVAELKLQNSLVSKQREDAKNIYVGSNNQYLNSIDSAFRLGDTHGATAMYSHLQQGVDQLVQTGAIKESTAQVYRQNNAQSFYKSQSSAGLNQLLNRKDLSTSDKISAANNYISGVDGSTELNKWFSPLQKKSQVNALHTQLQTWQQANTLSKAQTKSMIDNLNNQAYATGKIDPAQMVQLKDSLSPEEYENAQHMNALYQYQGQLVNQAKYGTLDEMNKVYQSLQDQSKNIDWSDPNAKEEQTVIGKSISDVQRIMKDKQTNPALYAMQVPGYAQAAKQSEEDPVNHPSVQLPQKLLDIEKAWGLPQDKQSVLPSAVAKNMAIGMNALPPDQMYNQLQELRNKYPDPYVFNTVVQDLRKNGLNSNPTTILSVMSNKATQPEINNVLKSQMSPLNSYKDEINRNGNKNGFKNMESGVDAALDPTISILTSQGIGRPEDYAQTRSDAYRLAAYYHYTGQHAGQEEQTAADVILNAHYNKGTMNGSNYLIPHMDNNNIPIDPEQAQGALKVMARDSLQGEIKIPDSYLPDVSPDHRAELYKTEALSQGHWQNNGSQGYMYVDYVGRPIMTKQGDKYAPLTVSTLDFNNSQSQLSLNYNKEIAKNMQRTVMRKVSTPTNPYYPLGVRSEKGLSREEAITDINRNPVHLKDTNATWFDVPALRVRAFNNMIASVLPKGLAAPIQAFGDYITGKDEGHQEDEEK